MRASRAVVVMSLTFRHPFTAMVVGPTDVVKAHNVNLQSYADDLQLYLRCQRQHMTTAGQRLEMCITDVSHWMAANRLKLNADKTELLWAGSKYGSTLLGSSGPPLRLGDETPTWRHHLVGSQRCEARRYY